MNRRMQSPIIAVCWALSLASTRTALCAQTPAAHIESALPWSNGAVTNAAMDSRIRDAAARYRAYAPVPRFTPYDMAYPKDSAEAAAMHGYAILVVTAIVQDSSELPLARVYVRDGSGDHELARVAATASRVPAGDADVRAVFGPFRWDAIYLFPLASRAQVGDLLADFAAHRQAFRLTHFDGEVPDQLAQLKISGAPGAIPPDAVVWTMIRREYPDLAAALGPK